MLGQLPSQGYGAGFLRGKASLYVDWDQAELVYFRVGS